MTKPVLDRPRIVAGIGEGIATGVPEHVRVHLEADRGLVAEPLDVTVQGISREWRAALGFEDIRSCRLAPELAQRSHFVAADWVRCRLARAVTKRLTFEELLEGGVQVSTAKIALFFATSSRVQWQKLTYEIA